MRLYTKYFAAFDKDVSLSEEELEQYHIAKRKMLGNIKFIGELISENTTILAHT